jgi:NADH-quinone oxidoreductase subunit N
MNSSFLWIAFPFLAGLVLLLLNPYRRISYYLGAVISFVLAIAAVLLPIDQAIKIGPLSLKIASTFSILGRNLVIAQADRAVLMLLFAITAFWLIGGLATQSSSLLPSVSFLMTSLLTASLAVKPFLYAAILIEGAVLVSLPLFTIHQKKKNPGVVRYLVFQTIGMPFMLITGWFLSGLQTGVADPQEVMMTIVFLGLGFGFTLAIFPLYSWIPMLAEEDDPFLSGYIFLMLPTAILFFLLSYVDQYSWLRESLDLPRILQVAGLIMIVTGGLWSAFQRDLGRMLGYAVIVENGFAVLAVGLMTVRGYQLFASMFLGRLVSFGLWALCLSLIRGRVGSLKLVDLVGLSRRYPLLCIAILAAQFSVGGLPVLAGYPVRTAIIEELASQSPDFAWMIIVGIAGIWISAIYSLYIFIQKSETSNGQVWLSNHLANVLVVIGLLILILMGLFPQVYFPWMNNLLLPYQHLVGI